MIVREAPKVSAQPHNNVHNLTMLGLRVFRLRERRAGTFGSFLLRRRSPHPRSQVSMTLCGLAKVGRDGALQLNAKFYYEKLIKKEKK